MNATNMTIPDALSNSLTTALEAARAAASSAAHVAASALIAATDGAGRLHRTWPGEGPDAWFLVDAPGFSAHLLRDMPGTAQIHFTGLSQQAYESVRDRVLEADECLHDDVCECLENPWPTWRELEANSEEREVTDRSGEEVGLARVAFGRTTLTLFEEPVDLVYELVRLTRVTD
ncbi:hypothetical protein [Streptomyces sp. NPDC015125]|uniref:hypothetical protein n=1 Tax=Streptomyces sp. NPDC015125 TaxID=3364938 RepID=UPI0036FCD727